MNKYTIGNNQTTIILPLDALTAQLKMQGLTLLLNHELPAFAAPPPASEGEMADVETVVFFELKNKKYFTKSGFEITTDMLMKAEHFISDDVCYIKVPLATLPTREQRGEKEKFAIRFSEWLMIQCEYKNHCVWEYRGEEYTQNELIEIFKRTTPLPSPPKH